MTGLDLSSISVLVTERHQQMRGIVCDILRQFGIKKVTPSTGVANAFELFAEHGADLIISDWSPDVNVLDLVRLVRHDPLSKDFYAPVIAVTSFCDLQRVCLARDAGIHEFLAKPFTAQHLYCRIRSIVEQPRLFIRLDNYFGPDRRRRRMAWTGTERRAHANRARTDRRTKKIPVQPDRRGIKVVDSRQDKRGSNEQRAA
ncbi:MAG: response regulator [Rhodospirillales bacterium]|nr:response regulator [Rhodospirillales bacterium]